MARCPLTREYSISACAARAGELSDKAEATPLAALGALAETGGVGIFVAGILTAL